VPDPALSGDRALLAGEPLHGFLGILRCFQWNRNEPWQPPFFARSARLRLPSRRTVDHSPAIYIYRWEPGRRTKPVPSGTAEKPVTTSRTFAAVLSALAGLGPACRTAPTDKYKSVGYFLSPNGLDAAIPPKTARRLNEGLWASNANRKTAEAVDLTHHRAGTPLSMCLAIGARRSRRFTVRGGCGVGISRGAWSVDR